MGRRDFGKWTSTTSECRELGPKMDVGEPRLNVGCETADQCQEVMLILCFSIRTFILMMLILLKTYTTKE